MKVPTIVIRMAVFIGAITAGGSAFAALTQYNDLAAFNAATSGAVVETYSSAPLDSFQSLDGSTLDGITYSGGYAFMVDPGYSPALYDWGTGPVLIVGPGAPETLSFTPSTAFAALFGSIGPYGANVDVTIDGIANVVATANFPNLTFEGWTSSAAFSSVTITGEEGAYPILDNVTLANAGAGSGVPEPASVALVGLGLLGLGLRGRGGK